MEREQELIAAIRNHDAAKLDNLLQTAGDLESYLFGDEEFTLLMFAVQLGSAPIVTLLISAGMDPNRASLSGLAPLHLAAVAGRDEMIAPLVGGGAQLDLGAGSSGSHAAHLAAASGHLGVLERLGELGADLGAEDEEEARPVDYAESSGHDACVEFLRERALWSLLDNVDSLRGSVRDMVQTLGEAKESAEQRAQEELDEEDAARPLGSLPPGAPEPPELDRSLMSRLASCRAVPDQEEFDELLDEHGRWLDGGAREWIGLWNSLVQSDIVFAIWDGPVVSDGEQLDLHLVSLEQVRAAGANLALAHLVGLRASGVSFEGASLERVMATDANFYGANFKGANLRRADFSRSDMRGCDFRGADLSFTDLEKCNLEGADFTGATLLGTKFPSAYLDGAIFE